MKRVYLLLLVLIAGLNVMSAGSKTDKEKADMRKEIRDFKIKFLAQEIELRDDQRARFAEVYGSLMAEEGAIWDEVCNAKQRLKNQKNLTDAEYEQVNAALVDGKSKGAALEKKYDAIFAKFLTPKQRYKMKDAEAKFRRKMEQMCSDKKGKKHKKK